MCFVFFNNVLDLAAYSFLLISKLCQLEPKRWIFGASGVLRCEVHGMKQAQGLYLPGADTLLQSSLDLDDDCVLIVTKRPCRLGEQGSGPAQRVSAICVPRFRRGAFAPVRSSPQSQAGGAPARGASAGSAEAGGQGPKRGASRAGWEAGCPALQRKGGEGPRPSVFPRGPALPRVSAPLVSSPAVDLELRDSQSFLPFQFCGPPLEGDVFYFLGVARVSSGDEGGPVCILESDTITVNFLRLSRQSLRRSLLSSVRAGPRARRTCGVDLPRRSSHGVAWHSGPSAARRGSDGI